MTGFVIGQSLLSAIRHRRPWRCLTEALLITTALIMSTITGPGESNWWLFLSVTVIARLGLMLRHRWPVVILLAQCGYTVAATLAVAVTPRFPIADAGVLIGLYAVARGCDRRKSAILGLSCTLPCGLQVSQVYSFDRSVLLFAAAGTATSLSVAWTLGYSMRQAARARAAAEAAERARRAERLQIARDLHDNVFHTVTVMLLQAAGARAVLAGDPECARHALDAVQEAGVQAMAELRRMLAVMRLSTDVEPDGDGTHRLGPKRLHELVLVPLVNLSLVAFAYFFDVLINLVDRPNPFWVFYGVEAVIVLGLLVRRRWPVAVFLVHLTNSAAIAQMFPEYTPFAGPLIALHAVARQRGRPASIAAALACAVLCGLALAAAEGEEFDDLILSVIVITSLTLVIAVVWGLGFSARQAAQAREAAEALDRSRRAERLQTARDLHDVVSHTVTVMLLQAAGARAVLTDDPDRARHALDAVQEAGAQAMPELRRMRTLMQLPDDTRPDGEGIHQPGLDHLDTLVQRMHDTGLNVTVRTEGTPARLDTSVDVTAYRVVQEALTNSTKYAGSECSVSVHLEWTAESLRITVADRDGEQRRRKRDVVLSTGHGLIGLRERVTAISGSLTTEPHADGFVVTATLPIATGARTVGTAA